MSTGLKSPPMMCHLTVIILTPRYRNFPPISSTVVILTALLISRCLILNSIAAAAELCLPKYRHSGHSLSSLSGWNNASLSLKQSARLWHKVWTECGCPTTGVLFQIKKNSKRRFKYEVRRLRRRQCHIKREKLANAFSHSSSRDFWKEVKKISKSTKGSPPNSNPLLTLLMVVVVVVTTARLQIYYHQNLSQF